MAMVALSPRTLLSLPLVVALSATSHAQTAAPASAGAAAAWTIKTKGDVRWQQVTPAGALLISTDAELAGVDIERGQVTWEKPELGGLPPDSVRMVEGSLLMEAARPGLLIVFDPVTGAVVFDSRRLSLAQVVTRRLLPQSGTLLVHGRRSAGPPASPTVRRSGPSPRRSTAGCTASCSIPTGSSSCPSRRPPIRRRATCAS